MALVIICAFRVYFMMVLLSPLMSWAVENWNRALERLLQYIQLYMLTKQLGHIYWHSYETYLHSKEISIHVSINACTYYSVQCRLSSLHSLQAAYINAKYNVPNMRIIISVKNFPVTKHTDIEHHTDSTRQQQCYLCPYTLR